MLGHGCRECIGGSDEHGMVHDKEYENQEIRNTSKNMVNRWLTVHIDMPMYYKKKEITKHSGTLIGNPSIYKYHI